MSSGSEGSSGQAQPATVVARGGERRKDRSSRGPRGRAPSQLSTETKFHPPQPRRGHVPRVRLVDDLLDAAFEKLVLIDAPAGYGKSTLLAEWIASPREARPFAFMAIDASDDDLLHFTNCLVESIRRVSPDFGGAWRNKTAQLVTDVDKKLVPRFVSELATLPRQTVIVLDDYHELREKSCHGFVDALIEQLPSTTQLVVATRSDPPLALGRVRTQGEVHEVREQQLRFGDEEAAMLMVGAAGVELPEADLTSLVQKTEGWPAGLYLAALSIRDGHDTDRFVREFAGTNRHVVEYLSDEVLAQQPADVQSFLIRTSILDRLSAPLCDAILGSHESRLRLEELQRSNLFLVALDEHQEWYRYHHLFGDLLRSRLSVTDPDLELELHRRAAAWHRRWGYVGEAIEHSIKAGDLSLAGEMIAENWLYYVAAGHLATVARWLSMIDVMERASDPVLTIISAWVAAISGGWIEAQEWLEALTRQEDRELPDGISVGTSADLLRASFGFGGFGEAQAAAERAVEACNGNFRWYPYARYLNGLMLRWSGRLDEAVRDLEEALGSNAEVSVIFLNETLATLAIAYCDQGRLVEAEELAAEALAIVGERGLESTVVAMSPLTAMGRVLAERGELHDASRKLESVIRMRKGIEGLNPWSTVETLLTLAPVRFARGDAEGAKVLLKEARRTLKSHPDGGMLQGKLEKEERMLYRRERPHLTPGEVLTDREMAVLRLLPSPLSQREIGDELFLSLNTIKSHVRAIFRKLDATSRREAVDRARRLGLI